MYDHVFLTGFKKFGTHALNPTEQVVNEVSHPSVTCSIIEVTTVAADEYINRLREELQARKGQRILHLHFGVGPNPIYFAENVAYNNKTFRIPDNAGYQPINEKIIEEMEFDQPVKTQVDIEGLFGQAGEKGSKWQHSVDPGRYLCNYLYFRSLTEFGKIEGNHSLFVHFPVHQLSPHERNLEFVQQLIRVIFSQKQEILIKEKARQNQETKNQ